MNIICINYGRKWVDILKSWYQHCAYCPGRGIVQVWIYTASTGESYRLHGLSVVWCMQKLFGKENKNRCRRMIIGVLRQPKKKSYRLSFPNTWCIGVLFFFLTESAKTRHLKQEAGSVWNGQICSRAHAPTDQRSALFVPPLRPDH